VGLEDENPWFWWILLCFGMPTYVYFVW